MKKKFLMLLLGTSLALAACGTNNADNKNSNDNKNNSSETANSGDGHAQKLFMNNCSSCHGQNLEGGFGPKLSKIGSELSKEEIVKTIANGKGQMPSGVLKGKDADAVANWLSSKK